MRADLAGLPPAFVALAEHDVLYDEGRRLAARLDAAGVDVTLVDVSGVNHGFMSTADLGLAEVKPVFDLAARWLAPRLGL